MTDNPFNIFEDMLNGFEDFLKTSSKNKPKENRLTKLEALIQTFEQEVSKGDKKFLKSAVVNYNDFVTKTNDQRLNKAHALASTFIENFSLGHSSLKRYVDATNDPLPNLTEALGLLAYQTKHFKEAIELFGEDPICEESALAYVCSQFNTGNTKITMYQSKLKPIINTSVLANTIIGKLHFDKEEFKKAEKYFTNAAEIEPENEEVRLNKFVNLLQQNKYDQVYPHISAFYVETGSKKTKEDLNSRLYGREIKVDMYTPAVKMYVIIKGLAI